MCDCCLIQNSVYIHFVINYDIISSLSAVGKTKNCYIFKLILFYWCLGNNYNRNESFEWNNANNAAESNCIDHKSDMMQILFMLEKREDLNC